MHQKSLAAPPLRPVLTGLALALLACGAHAAGYRFGTQSAAAEGTANANAAEAADASTLFANPAGITRLKGINVSGVLDYVDPSVRFTDAGSSISLPGSGFQPRPTAQVGDTQSIAKAAVVPHMYASYQIDDSMTAGLAVFVPWGTKIEYQPNWGGRYNLQKVELQSLAFNPNIAWKPAKDWSVAAGVTAEYMKGDLQRAVPYASVYAAGLLHAAQQAAAGGAPSLALQLQQQAAAVFGSPAFDGSIRVKGKDWGLGLNFAVLWDVSPDTRLGMAYRSSISHKLKGSGDWTQPANLPAAVLAAVTAAPYNGVTALDHNDSSASLAVNTPESLSLHGFHQLTPTIALLADVTFTRDSRLSQLRINFGSTTAPSITAEHWKNTSKVSVGAQWRVMPDLLLRTGYAQDNSPVPSLTRGPALPDSHRTWLAFGANYQVLPTTSVDLSVGKVKLKDASMNITDDGEGEQPCNCAFSTARGNFNAKATIFGVQLNHKF
jgi:long-chain fatty acid transport protein